MHLGPARRSQTEERPSVLDKPVETLVSHSASLLAEYLDAGRTRTDLLKEIAEDVVELRSMHHLEDGQTDWSGRSPEYRRAVSELYRRARVPHEQLDTVQAALRYHVGNLLRQRATAEDLAGVGLSATSPKERLARQRAVVNALAAVEDGGNIRTDPPRLLAFAEVLVGLVDAKAVAALSVPALVASQMSLDTISAQAAVLLDTVAEALGR